MKLPKSEDIQTKQNEVHHMLSNTFPKGCQTVLWTTICNNLTVVSLTVVSHAKKICMHVITL